MKTLFLFCGFACAIMGQSVTVSVKSPVFPGLTIVRPTDPGLQPLVSSALRPDPASELAGLLPYSLLVQNNTPRTICAYTLRLTYVDVDGRSGGRNRQYFNFDPTVGGIRIPPGEIHLVTPSVSMKVYPQLKTASAQVSAGGSASRVLDALKSQTAVTVSMDLVVFDNGQVIGPDEGNTLEYLKLYLDTEREIASIVHSKLLAGASVQQVADDLARLEKANSDVLADIVRAGRARNLLRLTRISREELLKEVVRVAASPAVSFDR